MTLTVVLWSEGDIILLVEMTGCAVMFLLLIILSYNSNTFSSELWNSDLRIDRVL